MKFRSTIEYDSITPYLDAIDTRLHASRKEIIYEIGKYFAIQGQERMSRWHDTLYKSVDDPNLWTLYSEEDFMTLDIVFTGLDGDVEQWWWEFEDENSLDGGRDYAFFQETGEDKTAESDKARNKWYVHKSEKPTQKFADEYLEKEIKRIMRV